MCGSLNRITDFVLQRSREHISRWCAHCGTPHFTLTPSRMCFHLKCTLKIGVETGGVHYTVCNACNKMKVGICCCWLMWLQDRRIHSSAYGSLHIYVYTHPVCVGGLALWGFDQYSRPNCANLPHLLVSTWHAYTHKMPFWASRIKIRSLLEQSSGYCIPTHTPPPTNLAQHWYKVPHPPVQQTDQCSEWGWVVYWQCGIYTLGSSNPSVTNNLPLTLSVLTQVSLCMAHLYIFLWYA